MKKTKKELDHDLLNEMLEDSIVETEFSEEIIQSEPSVITEDSVQTIPSEYESKFGSDSIHPLKRPRGKQLKTSFEEYRQ